MTIDEAIKVLTDVQLNYSGELNLEEDNALGLGIEALKRIRLQRAEMERLYPMLLPGETKD